MNHELGYPRFISQPIEVMFNRAPLFSKKPHCPDQFIWDEETFTVAEVITEWQDFQRRGRMARNMRPENLVRARRKGSWGVGRFYFRVVANGRLFDLYYDRAPKGLEQRAGRWFLAREFLPEKPDNSTDIPPDWVDS